jgi:transcriptional pleiotropic regulator of transition state genes
VRKIGKFGSLVIPKEIRILLGWDENTLLEIFIEENHIVLRKYSHSCVFCGTVSHDNIVLFGKEICAECAGNLKEMGSKQVIGWRDQVNKE